MNTRKQAMNGVSAQSLFHNPMHGGLMMRGAMVTRAPEDDRGQVSDSDAAEGDAVDAAAAAKAAVEEEARAAKAAEESGEKDGDKAKDDQKDSKAVDDEKAKLLKEVMKYKAEAKQFKELVSKFEGIDPEKARAALEAQQAAELKELEAKGEYQRIIAQVSEQADAKVKAAEKAVEEVTAQLNELRSKIEEQNVANKFATSTFIRDNLVISGEKVRILYGDYFDTVDGEPVPYDKPRGAKERTPLVDAGGNPLSFEAAIEKIIKSDPEWERLAKSNLKKGAGSHTNALSTSQKAEPTDNLDRIRMGLSSLKRTSLNLRGQ